MALCVQQVGNALEILGEYSASCTGFAVMTAQEYASVPTLASLFATPDSAAIRAAFMSGLSLPLILWLTAWGFGAVLEFVRQRHELPQTIDE